MGRMRATLMLMIGAALAVCGCKRQQIYSKQSVPVSLTGASSSGAPAFVGRWAATRSDCEHSPWILTPTELDTPGRTHCSFAKLSAASAGYAADVACSGSGAQQIGRITLTLSGQGDTRGLTLGGGPFTLPVALTACPAVAAG